MGKRTKKSKKPNRVEVSKAERFVRRGIRRLFIFLAICTFSFMLLNIAFYHNVSIRVELYFIIVYVTTFAVALFIVFGVWNSLFVSKVWDNKNIKNSLFIWLGRSFFLAILIIDFKIYVVPMTLDVPALTTGNFKEISGTVKSIEINDDRLDGGSSKGDWYEKIKYVYFTEQTSETTIRIIFHASASNPNVGYNIKTIYYLPHTKWGMKVE
jgi:hypothetical protein